MNWKIWFRRLGIVVLVAALFIGLLYALQERLIFHQPSLSPSDAQQVIDQNDHVEEVSFQSKDDERLHGWLLHPQQRESEDTQLLIYYGGNAEELSMQIPEMSAHLEDWSVLLVNYRGYGMSEGSPGEEVLYADALTIYDEIRDQLEGEITSTVLMGRSLGTGVATKVASEREVDGLVFVSAFDTFTEVARLQFPFLPVSWLLQHEFDSLSRINDTSAPLLAIAGDNDEIVPKERSRALLANYEGTVQFETLAERGHNDLHLDESFWPLIREFLDGEL
ncbi:alpha/beta hydrolase [Natribacillus halophilus]|uniref:alpha/beta hydrolase n=1 Tax=Natribacillus halophilus TaxID=549003 RepID=UPI00115FC0C3|nr:alpha/beta hydrolase [Natribacillus halophilus]